MKRNKLVNALIIIPGTNSDKCISEADFETDIPTAPPATTTNGICILNVV